MRTTINIDDDALYLARELAEARGVSLGDAASFLIRRGLSVSLPHQERNGFALFNVATEISSFGLEDVERAVEQEDQELSSFFTGHKTDGASA
jgi:hypothetical protein